jgi:hypothetical protein
MSLPVALLVVPLRTLTSGNCARAHGARAKAGTRYFFLSFFHMLMLACGLRLLATWLLGTVSCSMHGTVPGQGQKHDHIAWRPADVA